MKTSDRAFSIVIPARYASTRLPGKALLDLAGQPMIQRVYERAQQSRADRVVVATDDERIAAVVRGFGGEVCMTRADHESGTDRIHEVVMSLQLSDTEIVVNVQGDEPLIPPEVINQVASELAQHRSAAVATLSEAITHVDDLANPNIVKVVVDQAGQALYFSRAAIPFDRDQGADFLSRVRPQRHIGLYAYRVSLLKQFVAWPMAKLEAAEKLEQLRILANGESIQVGEAMATVPGGVDTEADLAAIRQLLATPV